MFSYDISQKLRKRLQKITKKDKVLVENFKRKLKEIISQDLKTINVYKNLKTPLNELKRINLTDNFILLFKVYANENKIVFVDILYWDKAYKND